VRLESKAWPASALRPAAYPDLVQGDGSTYRSPWLRLAYVLVAVALAVLGVWLAGPDLAAGHPAAAVATLAACLTVGALATELLWRPTVRVSAGGVALVNPLRTTFLPWKLLVATESAYGLRLLTDDWHYRSWAASAGPSPGRTWRAGWGITGDNPMGAPFGMNQDAGPTLRSVLAGPASLPDSAAKLFVDQAWQTWQADGTAREHAHGSSVEVTWHWRWMATALVAAATAALAGLLAQ
jgi:Bacterial PH domain